jgi:protease I
MNLTNKKIGILMESDFYYKEISYYQLRFEEQGIEVDFLTRLWGTDKQTYLDHEYKTIPIEVTKSFENMSDDELKSYSAIIVPAGIVSDRLRYTEDVNKLPPACDFMKRVFAEKSIIKGIICHGLWIMSPIKEVIEGRNLTTHNNLIADAKNMGANYINENLVVDGDLVTARTGDHCNIFASKIIEMI